MTGREQIRGLFSHDNLSRMGLYDIYWTDAVAQWVEEGHYPSGSQDDELAWFDIPRVYEHNRNAYPMAPQYHFGSEFNTGNYSQFWFDIYPMANHHPIVEENDEVVVRLNGAGARLRTFKNRSGVPEHLGFDFTGREQWESTYREPLLELDTSRFDMDKIRRVQKRGQEHGKWTYYGTFYLWENARQCMGDVNLLQNLLLDPDFIHDMNRVYTDFFKTHFQYLFDQAGVPDGMFFYEDMAYKNTTFAAPETFAELYFPYYEEIVDWLHGFDIQVVLHCCGFVEPLLPHIVGAGFDALHAMEQRAGCDLLRISQQYGRDIALIGGIEAEMFESGDRDWMRRRIDEVTDAMKSDGTPYCFASDHSISTNVSYGDYRYAVEYFRERCDYK